MTAEDRLQQRRRRIVTAWTLSRAPFALAAAALALGHAAQPSPALLAAVLGLLALSGVSDLVDGALARRWGVVSRFGALADPLMDKVFFVATLPVALFLALRAGDTVHAALLLGLDVLSMLRDQWVSFLRSVGAPYGADMRATLWGKLRTALAFPVTVLIYLALGLDALGVACPAPCRAGLFALELLLMATAAVSGLVYTRNYWPWVRRAMRE